MSIFSMKHTHRKWTDLDDDNWLKNQLVSMEDNTIKHGLLWSLIAPALEDKGLLHTGNGTVTASLQFICNGRSE
jgi:hypothetical protein